MRKTALLSAALAAVTLASLAAQTHDPKPAFAGQTKAPAEEKLFLDLKQRIREVRQGPDGALYLIAGASLVRVVPKR